MFIPFLHPFYVHSFLSSFLCSFLSFLLSMFIPLIPHFYVHCFLFSFLPFFLPYFNPHLKSSIALTHSSSWCSHEGTDLCCGTFQQEESSCRAYILSPRYLQIIFDFFLSNCLTFSKRLPNKFFL